MRGLNTDDVAPGDLRIRAIAQYSANETRNGGRCHVEPQLPKVARSAGVPANRGLTVLNDALSIGGSVPDGKLLASMVDIIVLLANERFPFL